MVYRLTLNHLILPLLQGSSYTPSKLPPKPLELWAYEVSRGPIIFEICRLMHMAGFGGAKIKMQGFDFLALPGLLCNKELAFLAFVMKFPIFILRLLHSAKLYEKCLLSQSYHTYYAGKVQIWSFELARFLIIFLFLSYLQAYVLLHSLTAAVFFFFFFYNYKFVQYCH